MVSMKLIYAYTLGFEVEIPILFVGLEVFLEHVIDRVITALD